PLSQGRVTIPERQEGEMTVIRIQGATRHPGLVRWHYTVGHRLDSILRDGVIRPATAYVDPGEKAAVWFSVNPVWEETANKLVETSFGLVPGTKETTHEMGGGLARIGVRPEVAPYDWDAFKALSGVTKKVARALYRAALAAGSRPGEWYVSFEPVLRERWLA